MLDAARAGVPFGLYATRDDAHLELERRRLRSVVQHTSLKNATNAVGTTNQAHKLRALAGALVLAAERMSADGEQA